MHLWPSNIPGLNRATENPGAGFISLPSSAVCSLIRARLGRFDDFLTFPMLKKKGQKGIFWCFSLREWKRESKEALFFLIGTQLFFNFLWKNAARTQKCQILPGRGNNVGFLAARSLGFCG